MAKAPKPLNVQPNGKGQWEVKRDGAERASSVHDKKSDAFDSAQKQAREEGGSLREKGKDGKIQDERTYHEDPHPPKG